MRTLSITRHRSLIVGMRLSPDEKQALAAAAAARGEDVSVFVRTAALAVAEAVVSPAEDAACPAR